MRWGRQEVPAGPWVPGQGQRRDKAPPVRRDVPDGACWERRTMDGKVWHLSLCHLQTAGSGVTCPLPLPPSNPRIPFPTALAIQMLNWSVLAALISGCDKEMCASPFERHQPRDAAALHKWQ